MKDTDKAVTGKGNAPRKLSMTQAERKGVTTEEFNRMFAQSAIQSGGLFVAKNRATKSFRKRLAKELNKYRNEKVS
jgi:hypothetical protein